MTTVQVVYLALTAVPRSVSFARESDNQVPATCDRHEL